MNKGMKFEMGIGESSKVVVGCRPLNEDFSTVTVTRTIYN